jgi:hypothetical protein
MMRHSIRIAAVLAAGILLTSCSSTPETPPVSSYLMGEKVQLGRLSYSVFETQWLTHIGEGPTARTPQNRFLLVRFSATNSGSEDVTVGNFTVTDDKGKVFDELTNGEGVPQWAGYLRVAKPADTIQGNVIFDAPAAHYKLKIADETNTRFALIDLPLTYGAETPEGAPLPGEKK